MPSSYALSLYQLPTRDRPARYHAPGRQIYWILGAERRHPAKCWLRSHDCGSQYVHALCPAKLRFRDCTLSEMLRDKDRITRMATAAVPIDLGGKGKQAVQTRIAEVRDISERISLQESLEAASKPDYGPILQYQLSDSERIRVHACHTTDHAGES